MSIATTDDHPGHDLIAATELPPAEALDAWGSLLDDDYESGRTSGVLIRKSGSFIGASAYLDHGVRKAVDILALALASSTDGLWAEGDRGERERDLDELLSKTEQSLKLFVGSSVTHRVMSTYGAVLRERELQRRAWEADDEDEDGD